MVNKDILNQYLDLREEVKEVRNKIEKLEKYIEKLSRKERLLIAFLAEMVETNILK